MGKIGGLCRDSWFSCLCVPARTAEAGQSSEFSGSQVDFGVETENLFSILFLTYLGMDICTKDPFKQLRLPDPQSFYMSNSSQNLVY